MRFIIIDDLKLIENRLMIEVDIVILDNRDGTYEIKKNRISPIIEKKLTLTQVHNLFNQAFPIEKRN